MVSKQLNVTMVTVAKEARVSRATVSRVLSGDTHVDPTSARRVRAAVAKLGYVRNEAASQLARRQSTLVGLLLRSVINPSYAYLQDALITQARDRGIFLVTVSTGSDDRGVAESIHVRRFMELRPAGLIVASGLISAQDISEIAAQVPAVVAPRLEASPDLYTVAYDERFNSRLIAQAVLDRGHRQVIVVQNDTRSSATEALRGEIMAQTLRAGGATVVEVSGTAVIDNISRLALRIEEARARGCTCAMFPNDVRALEFLAYARETGLEVPGHLSVTGIDGVGDAVVLSGLTTVRNPFEDVARATIEAIAVLIGHAEGRIKRKQAYPGVLIEGTTLAHLEVGIDTKKV